MKIKRFNKHAFLETCAASDIAFLLIIYFLVIAGFNINKGFIMNLSGENASVIALGEEPLRFEMDSSGEILFGEEVLGVPDIKTIILSARKTNPNIVVAITIDRLARWQNVVSFIEAASDLQIDSFSFSMKKGHQ